MLPNEWIENDPTWNDPTWGADCRWLINFFMYGTSDLQDADDLRSETLKAAFKAFLRHGKHPTPAYIHGIARRKLAGFYRRPKRVFPYADLQLHDHGYYHSLTPGYDMEANEQIEQIIAVIADLLQRDVLKKLDVVILAYYLLDYENWEIVEALGLSITPETVGNRRSRTIRLIREQIKQQQKAE